MADPALERWRERCKASVGSGLGIAEQGIAKALEAADSVAPDDLPEKLALMQRDAAVTLRSSHEGLRLALRWLREEMERGDD